MEEMLTVVVDGVFVGRISFVSEASSQVVTLFGPGLKIQTVVRQEGQEGVLARGLLSFNGNTLYLTKVLQEEEIRAGDWVFTSGEDGLAPNVPIGKIVNVFFEKGRVYKKAEVEPFFKKEPLEVVFLVRVK